MFISKISLPAWLHLIYNTNVMCQGKSRSFQVASIAALVLVLTIFLTSCASSETNLPAAPTTTKPAPGPTASPSPVPDDYADIDPSGLVITFWHPWQDERRQLLERFAAEFNSDNPYAITVVLQDHESLGALSSSLIKTIRQDDHPSAAVAYASQYLAWKAAGTDLLDLTSLITSPSYGLEQKAIEDLYPAVWQADLIEGRRYGMPAEKYGQVIFYNSSWAQQLGFTDPPATTEEFEQQACTAAAANGDGSGGWFANPSAPATLGWLFAFGTGVENPNGGYFFNTPQGDDAFRFLAGLYQQGCAWSPGSLYPNDDFANRKGLFYTSSIVGIPYQEQAMAEYGSADRWLVIPFPSSGGEPAISLYGPSYVLFESTPQEQLAAWLFLRYLLQPDKQFEWVQAAGSFTLQRSLVERFTLLSSISPHWGQAQELMPYARNEPRHASWSTVYGTLADAAAELYQDDLDPLDIPQLLLELQSTADEIHALTPE